MHNQKQEAHTMMWETFGEISAPFLKKRKGPRAHDEDVSHHRIQGGHRDPQMQRVIYPFKVTVQRRDCWPDTPVSTSVALNNNPKSNIPSGLLK